MSSSSDAGASSAAPGGRAAHGGYAAPAAPGDRLERVDTPALILDLDAFEANVAALHAHAAARGVRVRAHGKAHRCPGIARRQVAAGAVGVCCQKVGEAEGFADATRIGLGVALAMLLLGLAGAVVVDRVRLS